MKRKFDKDYKVECMVEGKWLEQIGTEKMTIKRIKELIRDYSGSYDYTFNETNPKARIVRRRKK